MSVHSAPSAALHNRCRAAAKHTDPRWWRFVSAAGFIRAAYREMIHMEVENYKESYKSFTKMFGIVMDFV